tara:strand:- start:1893 stop:2663 length:771 start_codon:yes stop_codon:yes gene_type:complete
MLYKKLIRKFKLLLTLIILYVYRKLGGSWNYFYSLILDYQERKTSLNSIISKNVSHNMKGLYDHTHGTKHLDLLINYGLKVDNKVLDFGCGYGRTAIPLIKYLNKDNFIGVELSKKRLKLAEEWVEKEKLFDKKAKFINVKDNFLNEISDNSINIIWTLSVFNHMPDEELHQCLKTFKRILVKGGKIFFYFEVPALEGDKAQKDYLSRLKTFPRTEKYMKDIIDQYSYSIFDMEDWRKILLGENKKRVRFWLLTVN